MKKVAVMLAPGFEEIEALTIVDILRRANIQCDTFGIDEIEVTGSHHITVKADDLIHDKIKDYDMIVLPGGMPGSTNLRDNEQLISIIKEMNAANKFVCAICAAPIVLDKAGVLTGKSYTAYVGIEKQIKSQATHLEELVVLDQNIITSRGPATVFHFAYALVEVLGVRCESLKEDMLFNRVHTR